MSIIDASEVQLIKELPHVCGPDAFVIDGGAGYGDWTAAVLEYAPSVAAVYCYEPHPEHIKILSERFKREPRVTILPYALAGECGARALHIDGDKEHRDFGSSLRRREFHVGSVLVEARSIREEVKARRFKQSECHLLKLDLEGVEGEVMEGMGHLRPHIIQFEYSINTWPEGKLGRILPLLEEWGYQLDAKPAVECPYMNVVARRLA